ncbi:MAG: magnesium transporter, partial [Planctomycetota bacterium]
GVSLGFLSGLLVMLAAWWLARDLTVAASVGTALFLAMSWTATMSCSVAMGSQALGLDPAFVSGPVQTAISDLSATTLFFGTASLLLVNGS